MHAKYADLLDPVYFEYAKMVEESDNGIDIDSLEQRRNLYLNSAYPLQTDNGMAITNTEVRSRDNFAIPVRLFKNDVSENSSALTIFLHGGGWVLGNLDTHHDICCDLCNRTNSNVLAIDYRLAPEHPFPTPLHDCIDAIKQINDNDQSIQLPEVTSVVLCGDSAGANLSAASILSGEVELENVSGQVLIYAGLGATLEADSFEEHVEAPILPAASLQEFFRLYLGDDTSKISELTSPLLADDLTMMPPTYISAADNDPLRDDSVAFYNKLQNQGIDATLQIEEKLGHGYLRVRSQSEYAIRAFEGICGAIVKLHEQATKK